MQFWTGIPLLHGISQREQSCLRTWSLIWGKKKILPVSGTIPTRSLWGPGIITNYQFYVSGDNKEWKLADEGEFSNIKNNPLWQTKKFAKVKARYIKLKALKNTEDNDNIGYAEVDVITE